MEMSYFDRTVLGARKMAFNPVTGLGNGLLILPLRKIFSALVEAGADPDSSLGNRESARRLMENFFLGQYNLFG